jgi:glycosyltransferase involved in cell wall biosynthesis
MSVKSTHALGNHTGKWPLVSVIVPTKNSAGTIEKCLKSIVEQTYPKIEVVIVDGLSRDNTRKIADEFKARIVTSPSKRSEARNMGAELSKGEYLLFIDSDMELDHMVIAECMEMVGRGCDALIIPEISVGQGFWAKCRALEKLCYVGDDSIEASRFFKRSTFETVGGYDINLEAGEDWDINERTRLEGNIIGRIKSPITHEEGKLTPLDSARKKYEYGRSIGRYKHKQPEKAIKQLTPFRASYVRKRRELGRDPVHCLGIVVIKTFEFGAGLLGLLKSKINGK